jgi:hypothetical protein
MNVSSVLAATAYDDASISTYTESADKTTATWTIKGSGSSSSNTTLSSGDTINGIILIAGTASLKKNDGGISIGNGTASGTIGIPVPSGSAGKLTISATSFSSGRYYTLYRGSTATDSKITKDGGSIDFTADDITTYNNATYLKLVTETSNSDNKVELKPTSIVVALTTGAYGEATPQDEYTITGTSNLTTVGDKFDLTLGNNTYSAEVINTSGAWKVTTSVDEGTTAPFGENSVLTVAKQQYDVSPANVTLSATDDDKTFNASEITFTKKELGYLADGTYNYSVIVAGLPDFEISNAPNAKINNGGYIGFKLEKAATVTVNAKIGTSSTGKSATLFYSTDKTAESGTNICQLTSTDNSFSDYTINLAAGTYYLICKSPDTDFAADTTSTSVQVNSITVATATDTVVKADAVDNVAVVVPASGDTYYAVLAVSEDTAKDNASFTFGGVSSDTVYESVVIGDKTYQASDFATGAQYLFAVQVTGVTDASDTAVSNIKNGVQATFTKVATDAE